MTIFRDLPRIVIDGCRPSTPPRVGPPGAMKLTMHLDEARVGRFSVFFATAATLFGLLGVITVARASESPMPAATTVRQGTMTERLRDPVTFERAHGDELVIVATSR
jgi:hypothetical protein